MTAITIAQAICVRKESLKISTLREIVPNNFALRLCYITFMLHFEFRNPEQTTDNKLILLCL